MRQTLMFWLLALLAVTARAGLFSDDDLLPVEKAFALQAEAAGPDRLRFTWTIADGYYLYRSKFRFRTDTAGVTLGEPDFPPGKVKHAAFFGEVETYRGRVTVEVPVQRSADAPDVVTVAVVSQGCADIGVCYPPQEQRVKLTLPPAPAAGGDSAGGGALKALGDLGASLGFGDEDELLQPDDAFRLNVKVVDARTVQADWQIADGYYMYRDKLVFRVPDGAGARLGTPRIPEGEHKNDEFFGDIQVFHQSLQVELPLVRQAGGALELPLTLTYQGCAERGVCYPPITKTVTLSLPAATGGASASPQPAGDGAVAAASHGLVSEQDAIARRLAGGSTLATLAAFFGFGLLLAFTPCVFPMVPILSSIIIGQSGHITAWRGFVLSSVYVLAMAATYTVAGVFAGLFGENLQAAFQNPWILTTFAGVFVLLALSMFGFYDLQMPAFLQSRLSEISGRQKGGSLTGVAVMGFLSALIVGPCVAAPLAGALIYIGQTGDAVLGGLALFALSLGMGAPLIAIGTGAGKLLPRAGDWMNAIKAVFGVLMLAVAIWLLERIIPAAATLLLWSALLIVSSVYLGALDNLPIEADGWHKLWKGSGVMLLVYGVMLLIGASTGASDPLAPLERLTGGGHTTTVQGQPAHLEFKAVKTVDDLDRELAAAAAAGRPVMLDFYADWCVSCKEMERYTFARPEVQQALSGFVLLQADVTANDAADKALLKRFKLIGPPSIIFFDAGGKERRDMRLVGFKDAEAFVQHVKRLR